MSRITTAVTTHPDPSLAGRELAQRARAGLAGSPMLAICFATTGYKLDQLVAAMQGELGDVDVWGASSSTGVFQDCTWVTGSQAAALMLIAGRAAGVGFCEVGGDARRAGATAARQAIARAGGTVSALLVTAFPGCEEGILAGIGDVAPGISIVGGSASDHSPAEDFQQIGNGARRKVVSVAAIGGNVGTAFMHGYAGTGMRAVITRAAGHKLVQLDGRPAMEVYTGWTGESVQAMANGKILTFSVLHPLLLHRAGGVFAVHPVNGNADGSIDTGVELPEGATIELGSATVDSMIDEIARVTAAAMGGAGEVEGLLLSHCGGRALGLGEQIGGAGERLPAVPAIGFLAFGEQGFDAGGRGVHANLSLSAMALKKG